MKRINLDEIIINEHFLKYLPKDKKMEECRNIWKTFGVQDRYIVINKNKELIDGYVQYLVLKENNIINNIEVRVSETKNIDLNRKNLSYLFDSGCYVFGYHPRDEHMKEYCWKVPEKRVEWAKTLNFGDKIFCETKYSDKTPVIVTRVLDELPQNTIYPNKQVKSKRVFRGDFGRES